LAYHVYILRSVSTGRYYVGQTDDLERRLAEHNDAAAPGSKYGPKNGPWRLVWSEAHATRAAAMSRERQIKSMRSRRWIEERLLKEAERVPARRD